MFDRLEVQVLYPTSGDLRHVTERDRIASWRGTMQKARLLHGLAQPAEPPYADPNVRWSGGEDGRLPPISISCIFAKRTNI